MHAGGPATTTDFDPFDASSRSRVQRPGLALRIVHHPSPELLGAVESLPTGRSALLGRAAEALFPGAMDLRAVSRSHAAVDALASGVEAVVRDLGSHNGTFVNGERVHKASFGVGDVLGIGPVLFLCHVAAPATVSRPHPRFDGESSALAALVHELRRIELDRSPVVLLGESGVGKDRVATTLHDESGRAGRLVKLACGSVSPEAAVAELCGVREGGTTQETRPGILDRASEGTLYLDDLVAAPPALQGALIPLVESGRYRRVGDDEDQHARVAIIAAAPPDAEAYLERGALRKELWYRLVARTVTIAPLRERREDIVPLALAALRAAHAEGRPLARRFALAMLRHAWPGNVRELFQVVRRAVDGSGAADEVHDEAWTDDVLGRPDRGASAVPKRRAKRRRPARAHLVEIAETCQGNVTAMATALGVDRKTVYRWIEAYGLELDAARDG